MKITKKQREGLEKKQSELITKLNNMERVKFYTNGHETQIMNVIYSIEIELDKIEIALGEEPFWVIGRAKAELKKEQK